MPTDNLAVAEERAAWPYEPAGRLSYLEQPRILAAAWTAKHDGPATMAALVLAYLVEHPGARHRHIRRDLDICSGTLSGTLMSLKHRGLIRSDGPRTAMQFWPA